MKLTSLFLLFICIASINAQEKHDLPGLIDAFPIGSNAIALSRPAQPSQYFDKIGRKAGLMGFENGSFEMWVWPWKPLRNFDLSILLGTTTAPLQSRDLARTISVTPEATTITYTYESFTVREHIIVPHDESGAIILLDVHNNVPLTIIAGFIPVMQPMWPAGIGGQFSYWDDDAHSYVISEGRWRAAFLCGSPAAQQMAAPPAHMFADNPLQFKIDVQPGQADGKFIPIVIGGGVMKMDSVKLICSALTSNPRRYYDATKDYYKRLQDSTVSIVTPRSDFNLAFEWGKVALDNLLITNPKLGTGLVAGYGISGAGGRPGFAWFFGGDAFINSLTFDGFGATSTVRDALAFTQQWQRQEDYPIRKKKPTDVNNDIGKMSHELSQSDGLIDWWNDYHYGYNHADTTPWYLVAMGDYVRTSGDTTFLRQSWKSVLDAYQWCLRKDSDGDGLMDLKGAGLGALEFGKLVGIYADMYTCGVWTQGIEEVAIMASMMHDDSTRTAAAHQFHKAKASLEKKFWMEKEGYYTYGATEEGEQVKERTPWVGTAFMFSLLSNEHTYQTMDGLNGAEICSDWGTRSLSPKSELFEPTNYNYGAAWPFISSFFGTAQFKHHYNLSGYSTIESVVRHVFDNGLGVVPEVFSGDVNQKLAEGYHHQGFSTTGYMLPMLRGLIGLEVNAPEGTVALRPHIPADWDHLDVNHVRVNGHLVDFSIVQSDSSMSIVVAPASAPGKLTWSPDLPVGAVATHGFYNRRRVVFMPGTDFFSSVAIQPGDTLTVRFAPVPSVLPPPLVTEPGATNASMKVISYRKDANDPKLVRLTVEGLAGRSYDLPMVHPELARNLAGGTIVDSHLSVTFDSNKAAGFARKEITFNVR